MQMYAVINHSGVEMWETTLCLSHLLTPEVRQDFETMALAAPDAAVVPIWTTVHPASPGDPFCVACAFAALNMMFEKAAAS